MLIQSTGSAGDKTVILWNVETGKMVNKLEGHTRFVTSCAFSPDNSLLATGSNDKSVIVWMIDQRCSRTNGTPTLITFNCEKSIAVSSRCAIIDWTVDDVVNWLLVIGMDMHAGVFRDNQVDGQELLHLTHDSLVTCLKIPALGHRNKILRAVQSLCHPQHLSTSYSDDSRTLLPELLCPITHEIMREPVVAADGYSYEKNAILTWIGNGNTTSPMTNEPLPDLKVIPNRTLSLLIQSSATHSQI